MFNRFRVRWDAWSMTWTVEGQRDLHSRRWQLLGRWYEWRSALDYAIRAAEITQRAA